MPLASPDTFTAGQTPESATLMASPLADRMGGSVTQERYQQVATLVPMLRTGLQMLGKLFLDLDPKKAAEIEGMASKLLRLEIPPMPMPSALPNVSGLTPSPLPPPMGMGGPNDQNML